MTLNQLIRNPRKPKISVNKTYKTLIDAPHKKGVCIKVFKSNPRKPNSGDRSTARVRLIHNKKVITAYIPGIGHNLREHSVVLVRYKGAKDLPGVSHSIIRGAYDCAGVKNRKTARSKYGCKLVKPSK